MLNENSKEHAVKQPENKTDWTMISIIGIAVLLGLALIIWGIIWYANRPKSGQKPTHGGHVGSKPGHGGTVRKPQGAAGSIPDPKSVNWNSMLPTDMANRVKYALVYGDRDGSGGSLTKFRSNRWDMIGYGSGWHFDWWVFPTPRSGSRPDFRVSTNPTDQNQFYSNLLNDQAYMKNFRETCDRVASSWGWSLTNSQDLPATTSAQTRTVYAIRYYKMCKCLAFMYKYSQVANQRQWIKTYFDSMIGPFRQSPQSRKFDSTIGASEWNRLQAGITDKKLLGKS